MKQQFLVNVSKDFQLYVYEDNAKAVPTSATITILKPNSTTKLITAQAMTVGSDGLLSYTLSTGNNDTVDENYHVTVTYVLNSVTLYTEVFYDVVYSVLEIVISDDDLSDELPQIDRLGVEYEGIADSGSTTTLVHTELIQYPDDFFNGGFLKSLTNNEVRKITDFVSATGTLTTDTFATAISTDTYVIKRHYNREIITSFNTINDWIYAKGNRPHLMMDSSQLRLTHIYLTVANVCKGLVMQTEDIWWDFWKEYEKKATDTFNNLTFAYDENEDGIISEDEEDTNTNVLRSGRA